MPKSLWLSYAWTDNDDQDVEFLAQELEDRGIHVDIDRWTLSAGHPLWAQIGFHIQDPGKSDGWAIYATANSLGSRACQEEYAYALDRALSTRGATFPVIGIFPSTVDPALIPPGIKTRLYVKTSDPDWQERVVAAVEGRAVKPSRGRIDPYILKIHRVPMDAGRMRFAIEVRPRIDYWNPFLATIPAAERDDSRMTVLIGAPNSPPVGGPVFNMSEGPSDDGAWWFISVGMPVSASQSAFVFCDKLPSELIFGNRTPPPQYRANLSGR